MSFTAVTFHGYSFFPVLWESSSIEYLSLTACSFEIHGYSYVESSSLKCLEVKYCHGLKFIIVHEAMNLESLTFVSPPPPYSKCTRVTVNNTPNLRKIDICVDELGELYLWQCHRALKATINTQNLNQFRFYGSLEAQVSVKACWKSVISVSELWDEEWFCSNLTNLSTLMDFLKGFGCCKKVWLCTRDFKALIFPETFRKTTGTLATPLPKSCILNVAMLNPPTARSRDYWDLKDSMNWIARSARIVRDNPRWLVTYLEEGGKQANSA
ncbi:hypothetical protein RchiOBHm_Chr4g0442941 [Rosa chinensis]|uniref:F-box/LRR-repeat protein 15/At3g58940/PEG3-like LRR domain-containing protein n=2 Tax=Rosa chinensis TaxID=74649 RepID=A0A2P6R3P7_ROSCH|nr:hypothetical protein RchiOBHm_Chr4g0442941 [Rosa chinensis]